MASLQKLLRLFEDTTPSNNIQLENLTLRQKVLADIIWACDSKEDLDRFVGSLPTAELRQEANSLVQLMIMSGLEPQVDPTKDMSIQQYLKKF